MAEQTPKKTSTTESPNEAYPQSAKEQRSAQRQQSASSRTTAASNTQGADEPTFDEEEQEEEIGHEGSEPRIEEDSTTKPSSPPEVTRAAGESGRRPRKLAKRIMEYPLADMYPEVQLLIEQKRREWDYRDPEIIRALFLETKTNAVSEWKESHATFAKRKKPLLEVQETTASKLRRQQLEVRQEKLQREQQREERFQNHQHPEFAEVKLATNLTTQLRYKYTRNNPPVPRHFLTHYERFKKPPFHVFGINGCRLGHQSML